MIRPFDMTGIARDANHIAHYNVLPPSLVEMLRSTVDNRASNEAIVEIGGPRIDYGELWDRASKVAGGLRELGIARGDRVAIRLGNGLDWCLAFWGSLLAGAIVVPVNTRFTEPEVEYVLNDSGSKFVFLPEQALPQGKPYAVEALAPADLAAIFYTSGTTGFPKGAMTTHENFLSNIENGKRVARNREDGSVRSLVSVPLFHVTGCNSQLLPCCATGSATVILPRFEVQAFLHAIPAERINSMASVPAIYWYAINQPNFKDIDTSGVERLGYGGAPMPPDLVGQILAAFPNAEVGNGFGLTETSSIATYLPHQYARKRPETVGFAAPVCDLELFETDTDGVGELLIRGSNVVRGYWNKPEATASTFVDGWLHTGDLARIDADGFVQIVDRKKDMVNRGGENVYCVEVENALAAHPAIFETAVMGVPDTMMGEKVGAIVVLKPGAAAEAKEIREFLRGRARGLQNSAIHDLSKGPFTAQPGRQDPERETAPGSRLGFSHRMKIAIAGGRGFSRAHLIPKLRAAGHDIRTLGTTPRRRSAVLSLGRLVRTRRRIGGATLDRRSKAAHPRKPRRWHCNLVSALAKTKIGSAPATLLAASAVGIYGSRGDEVLTGRVAPRRWLPRLRMRRLGRRRTRRRAARRPRGQPPFWRHPRPSWRRFPKNRNAVSNRPRRTAWLRPPVDALH